jgi:hypothetical protein
VTRWGGILKAAEIYRNLTAMNFSKWKNWAGLFVCLVAGGVDGSSENCLSEFRNLSVQQELGELRAYLTAQYPPDQFNVLGIGQSPRILIDDLKRNFDTYAARMELSNFRPLYSGPKTSLCFNDAIIRSPDQLSPIEKSVFHLFEQKVSLNSSRDIVLVDYASSGATLVSAYFFLKRFLRSKDSLKKVHIFALVGTRYRSMVVSSMSEDLGRLQFQS